MQKMRWKRGWPGEGRQGERRKARKAPCRSPCRRCDGRGAGLGRGWWEKEGGKMPVCAPAEAEERGSTVEMGGMAERWWSVGRYVTEKVWGSWELYVKQVGLGRWWEGACW